MVVFVGDDKTTFRNERRDDRRVGCETHRGDKCVLLTKKTGDERFSSHVQLGAAAFQPSATSGHTITTEGFLCRICASTLCLSKPKIIVRRDVEGSSRGPGEIKAVVVILGFTVKKIDGPSGNASDRGRKTIIYTRLEPPSVKGIEVRVERCIAFIGKKVTVESGINTLSKEIAYVAYENEEEIAQIGGEENVVWRVLFIGLRELGPGFMRRSVSITFVCTETKLQMVG